MNRRIILIFVLLLEVFTIPLWACSKKVVLSADKPLKGQMKNEGVVYVVRSSFDLNGETLIIPTGCQLLFEGGVISNGTLQGDNTIINASKLQIFSDVIILGSWDNKTVYGDWFDFDVSGKYDNIRNFKNLMGLCTGRNMTHLYLSEGIYCVSQVSNSAPINVPSNVYWHNSATIQLLPSDYTHYAIVSIKQADNVVIDGGVFVGDLKTHFGTIGEWGHGIKVEGSSNVTIKNLQTLECWGDGIDLVEGEYVSKLQVGVGICNRVTIDNVKSLYNRRQGLSIEAAENVVVKNSEFAYTGTIKQTNPSAGIDIEAWCKNENKLYNIRIQNCICHDNYGPDVDCIPNLILKYDNFSPQNNIRFSKCIVGTLALKFSNKVEFNDCIINKIYYIEAAKNTSFRKCTFGKMQSNEIFNGVKLKKCTSR
jgi:hypothetical protein